MKYLFINKIAKHIDEKSLEATKNLAKILGEPEACKGHGVRNATRIAIAPNLSSAVAAGGESNGIEPYSSVTWVQGTASGDIKRVVPAFVKLAKDKGMYSQALIEDIANNYGSVQHLDWLTDHEKLVFKTAFEIDQKVIIRYASQRQKFIDQAQSINLFFSAHDPEEYISEVHEVAFKDPYIKSLYYIRSTKGVQGSKNTEECVACEG